jgi:hypothetical protein
MATRIRLRRSLLWGIVFVALAHLSSADDWARSEPVSFHTRGFSYVAEVFPPKARHNATGKPVCYFYAIGYPGTDWKVDAKLVWKGPLVNPDMPYEAVLSMGGDLVTLNEYGHLGFENSVVIYSRQGKLVKAYSLDELIPAADVAGFERSVSSRYWNRKARYYFLSDPLRFYVVLPQDKVVRFQLSDGQHRYGAISDFPEIAKVTANPSANELVEVWRTSLRFSSVTDVLAARAERK